MKLLVFFAIASVALAGLSFIFLAPKASAFSPNYNPSDLIDNPTFMNNSTMSAPVIQSFLSNVGSGLAGYTVDEDCNSTNQAYYSHCGQTVSAAQIIYDASQAYGINPQDVLATMEKEQSLVTDPTPSTSQLNCAMGYELCGSNYLGFFNQIDNGAWQLRYNYEMSSGNTYWGYSPSTYACANASSLYSAGLLPGNTVTFADPGGTAETITIANAATAALYCYTPYVGPYSQTGYSGSYNFVYYFQLWWGSTQASTAYAWVYEGQQAYVDSGMTTPATGTPTVAPGQDIYMTVEARNVGYQTWEQSNFHLGTANPYGRISPFYDSSTWLDSTRPAGLSVPSVPPGGETTIDFTLQAPSQPGVYNEYYNLVADGVTWLNNPGFYYTVNVVPAQQPSNLSNTGLSSGQTLAINHYLLSPDTQSTLNLLPDGDLVLYENFLPVWSNGVDDSNASYLIMQSDDNLVEYDKSGNAIWNSGTNNSGGQGDCSNNNQPETTYLTLQSDGNLVIYCNSGGAIWASGTFSHPSHLDYVNTSLPDGVMYPGQSIETANLSYKLTLQTDGNLVLYNQSDVAIWASGTAGDSVEYLDMQTDGNLVIYGTNGQALWNSQTSGKGSASLDIGENGSVYLQYSWGSLMWNSDVMYPGESIVSPDNRHTLTLQTDGNLVLYNQSDVAIWASGTAGESVSRLIMQTDGNLVIYGTNGQALWNSHTNGTGLSNLAVQDDGNMVIYGTNGQAYWSSNTYGQ